MTPTCATLVGIIFQLFGAGYLVFQSGRTSRNLSEYPTDVTYDTLGPIINALTAELRRQFFQQVVGFVFVVVGSLLQLYGAWVA
jgi:hypothetical protein